MVTEKTSAGRAKSPPAAFSHRSSAQRTESLFRLFSRCGLRFPAFLRVLSGILVSRIIFPCLIFSGCVAFPSLVILTDPLSGPEHFQLGLLHEKEGRFSSAVAAYRAAISQGILAHGELGNAHFQNGDFYAAERAYRVALHRHSDNGPILNNLAQTYLKRRTRLGEAELLVRQALLLDRRDPAAPYTPHYLDTLAALHAMNRQRMETRDGW
jgi:tetratricopeptide (TPR) repeat protein